MRSSLLFLLAALPLLPLGAAPQFAPKPVSPRSCKLEKRTIPLMAKGKVKFALYVPKNASASVKTAAKEFAALLTEICGAPVKPVNQLPADKSLSVLHLGDPALAGTLKADLAKVDRDGFVIIAEGNKILIAGGDALTPSIGKGTLYGAYDFLERFAGARFYFPGKHGTLLPRKSDWSVPAMTIFDRPDSQYRRIYWKGLNYGPVFWYDPAMKPGPAQETQRNRLRLSTLDLINCHGLAYMGYVKRFAKTHPEYFAVKDDGTRADGSLVRVGSDASGQLCWSSGILEEIYQDAKAVLTGPEAVKARNMTGASRWYINTKPFFNLMPNDSMARCRCPKCGPYFEGLVWNNNYSRKAADFLWSKLLSIPRRLKKEGVPGFVTMMAYDLCREVPNEPIPDNVVIQVAASGPWKERKKAEQAKDEKRLQAWVAKTGSKIYLWNYVTKLAVRTVPAVPNFTPRAIGKYYKDVFKYSFGTFLEAESDCWFFGHLNFYVFSKVMWDHTTDVDALLAEYRERMFEAGAAPMKEIMDSLEDHWLDDVMGNTVDTALGPVTSPPSEYKLWNVIFSPKEVKRIEGLFAKAEKLAAKDKDAVERIRMVRRSLWGPAADAAAAYFRKAAAVDYWRSSVGLLKEGEKIVIDGKGDEEAWKNAPCIALIPLDPRNKKVDVDVHTFVKLLADKENFYFLFDCREPLTDKMRQLKRPFDDKNMWADNAVEIYLDTEGKRREHRQIMVDSRGEVADLRTIPGKLFSDWKWNSGTEAKTSVVPGKGWFAEVRVPRKSLPPLKGDSLVAHFTRHRTINGMQAHPYYVWSPYAKSFGDLPNFGVLYLGPLPEKNLYSDGDFEFAGTKQAKEKGSFWFNWGPMPARDEKIFRTAGVSVCLEGGTKKNAIIHRVESLKPNTTYRLSFFVRQENVKLLPGKDPRWGAGFYIRIDDGVGIPGVRSFPKPYFGSVPWTRWEYTFKTGPVKPGTKYKPYHHYILRNATGKVWIDHAELVELPDKK